MTHKTADQVANDVENRLQLAETRAARLAMIMEGYEVGEDGAPDATVPGAARIEYVGPYRAFTPRIPRVHPRYVLVAEMDRGGYRLFLANDRVNVEQLAVQAIYEGDQPVCYFDLDELAGDEPILVEGDRVRYLGKERIVSHHDYEAADGESYPVVYLEREGSDPWEGPIVPEEVELIERAEPDERMPVRYGVAKVLVSVVFNTEPSPA